MTLSSWPLLEISLGLLDPSVNAIGLFLTDCLTFGLGNPS